MTAQPLPVAGSVDVTPVARALFLTMLLDREVKGVETYGRSLQTMNGRDAIRDLMEELIDGWQYAVQIQIEHDALIAERDALRAELARWQRTQP